ncbi:MAG TPA: inositol monophosphatase family protein [Thermoanaerobaculia bacterium]|nr:inositol monophosphatase family protein [Thermoanaerobaculia bacterium]
MSETERYLAAALAACRRAGEIHREHFRSAHLQVELKKDASPVTVADRGSEEAIREILHGATPELGFLGEEFGQEGSERDRWIIDPIDATKNFVAGLPFFATLIGLELGGELVLGVVHAPALGPGSGLFAAQPGGDAAALGETWWGARGEGAWGGTGTVLETCRQRRLRVSETSEVERAFVAHGGLKMFQRRGLWPAFTDLVARTARTRGFGDWWGHILVAEGRCDAMVEGEVALHDVAALKPILEEAGGVLLTRGGAPLATGFQEGTLSSNRNLAEALRGVMGF